MATKLLDEVQAAEAAAKAEAAATYRALLVRLDDSKKGDAESLARVLAALGKSVADVEADAEVLRQAVALEVKASGLEVAQAARIAAYEAANVSVEETRRIARERGDEDGRLLVEAANLLEVERRCSRAAEAAAALKQQHPALFGVEAEPPAA